VCNFLDLPGDCNRQLNQTGGSYRDGRKHEIGICYELKIGCFNGGCVAQSAFGGLVNFYTNRRWEKMKLGIIGAVALVLGIWALVYCWWFVVEIIEGLVALGLVVGGALAMAIAIRRMYRVKTPEE